MAAFPHSNLVTDYSFLEAVETPTRLIEALKDGGVPVAIADRDTLAGGLEIGKLAKSSSTLVGVGMRVLVKAAGHEISMRLHARNENGWRELCGLMVGKDGKPVALSRFEGSSSISAVIADTRVTGKPSAPSADGIERLATVFSGRLYVEDLRAPEELSGSALRTASPVYDLARQYGAVPIATAPVRYWHEGRRSVWRALRQVAATRSGVDTSNEVACHALTSDEMRKLFPGSDGQALAAAERFTLDHCWAPSPQPPILPVYKGASDPAAALRERSCALLQELLAQGRLRAPGVKQADYHDRLAYELDVICKLGFASYFLIVSDFCQWARANGISVGPGRGSGAGSLVARCIGITAVDPVAHGLYFERFLNPDRVSLPDFDIDFEEDRCPEMFAHLRREYGGAHVARIATYSYLRAKSAIKEIAAAQSVPFNVANAVTAAFPAGATISEAMGDAGFQSVLSRHSEMRQVCELAKSIEGLKRQIGLHPAGVVISLGPVADTAPVFLDDAGQQVTAYDMKSVEASGLVKFDLLSLSTLSIISEARHLIQTAGGALPREIDDMPVDDAAVYDLLAQGRSVSVFQFDQMNSALRTVKPKQFSDLVSLNALYRPGPIANIPLYADRKARSEAGQPVDLDLPPPSDLTGRVLGETYGIMVYQEQVMEIAKICAGFTLGQADLLRRAIGKKIPSEIAAARDKFIVGCQATTGMPQTQAEELFSAIERFADYGFNKSHAVAYAHLGYVTAYYKVHHSAAWFAAALNRESDSNMRHVLADEAQAMGVPILAPDVNLSSAGCTVVRHLQGQAIRLGLSFPKGITPKTPILAAILRERTAGGPFQSLLDFGLRLEPYLAFAQTDSLAWSGAFDDLAGTRAGAAKFFSDMLAQRTKRARAEVTARHDDQFALFGGVDEEPRPNHPRLNDQIVVLAAAAGQVPESIDRLAYQRDKLGFVTNNHPAEYIISRASEGRLDIEVLAKSVSLPIFSVQRFVDERPRDVLGDDQAGRIAVVGNVLGFKIESSSKQSRTLTATIELGANGRRQSFRMTSDGDRLQRIGSQIFELKEHSTPALIQLDWASGEAQGDIDFRIVDVASVARATFGAVSNDVRVKLKAPQGLPSQVFVTEESRKLVRAIRATFQIMHGAPGILLITDGQTRTVSALEMIATSDLIDLIARSVAVAQVYQGKKLIFDDADPPRRPVFNGYTSALG
jgi:DNA polymerase-3 subunit alpha